MAYLPNTWVDQNVQRPKTYNFTQNDDGSTTLIDAFGNVTELGTPVNADYMNHIENGIAGCAIRKYSTTETFIKGEWVQADLDGVQGLYESLTNSNLGNPLSDETKWKKVDLGGGSGTGGGFSLFDVVEKDHILSFEESMGFGLLGTYVYKEPVTGSRYGYSDFYNECVAQKEAGTEETITVGDVSFTATKNPNGHIFYDIADKATVDEIFSQRGEAWFYGVDTENERIFLPRGTRSQYTINTDETGDYVEAGLPNIKSSRGLGYSDDNPTSDVPPFVYVGSFGNVGGGSSIEKAYSFDASTANPIYGKSDTVQPYATKKLLYIVVGNVKVQSAASDVVDVTTTENDTVPLFTGQYFDFKPNNVSWVKANTTPSGNVYLSTYNELVNCLVEANNKYGLKVVDVADMIAGVDYSLYWKVNQTDMTFTTPSAILTKSLDGAVVGNGMTLGLTDGTNNVGLGNNYSSSLQTNWAWLSGDIYGTSQGTAHTAWTGGSGNSYGVTTDATKSGIIAQESTAQLYFKVANAVENLDLLDAGEVLEVLATKVDKTEIDSFINDNALNITNTGVPDNAKRYNISAGYTAPTSGWVFLRNLEESRCHIIIDGIDYDYANDWGDGGSENSIIWKVGKGQVISWSGRISAALFIPDKLIGVE